MPYDPTRHHRRSIRLPGYDDAEPGAYFVTVGTMWGRPVFGEIVDDRVCLSEAGQLVEMAWLCLPDRFPWVSMDEAVVMPNHLHGIMCIEDGNEGAMNRAPTTTRHRPPIGEVLRVFKSVTTRQLRLYGLPWFAWQRNYYEHIVRNDKDLDRIRRYIVNNPANWATDPDHAFETR